MTIKTTQKIIKIGDSRGVTLPAKQLQRLGVQTGDQVEITIRSKANTNDQVVMQTAQSILERYQDDFKNLAAR